MAMRDVDAVCLVLKTAIPRPSGVFGIPSSNFMVRNMTGIDQGKNCGLGVPPLGSEMTLTGSRWQEGLGSLSSRNEAFVRLTTTIQTKSARSKRTLTKN